MFASIAFQCPLTTVEYTLQQSGDGSLADSNGVQGGPNRPFVAAPRRGVSTAPHPLLTAALHPAHESRLALCWQVWRTVQQLASAGWLQWTGPLPLLDTTPRTMLLLLEQSRALLAHGPRRSVKRAAVAQLPNYRIEPNGDGSQTRALLQYVAGCVDALAGGNYAEFSTDELTTTGERIQQIKEDVAQRIARKRVQNTTVAAAMADTAEIMQDLAVSGWTTEHTAQLLATANARNKPVLAQQLKLRALIRDYFPEAHFVGLAAYSKQEMVLQHLDTVILDTAIAMDSMAMTPEESAYAQAAISDVRNTYAVEADDVTDDSGESAGIKSATALLNILPAGNAASNKHAVAVANKLRTGLRSTDKADYVQQVAATRVDQNTQDLLALLAAANPATAGDNMEM